MVRILMRSIINYRYQMESEGQEFMCEDWFNTRIFVIFWVTVVVLTCHYHNLLKMLYFKWISDSFEGCQLSIYIADITRYALRAVADDITNFLSL